MILKTAAAITLTSAGTLRALTKLIMLMIHVEYILNLVMVFIGPGRIGLSRG